MQVLPTGRILFSNPFEFQRGDPINPEIEIPWIRSLSPHHISFYYRTTNDSAILDRVVNITTGFNQNFSDYQPSMAIILTWKYAYIQPIQVSMHIHSLLYDMKSPIVTPSFLKVIPLTLLWKY